MDGLSIIVKSKKTFSSLTSIITRTDNFRDTAVLLCDINLLLDFTNNTSMKMQIYPDIYKTFKAVLLFSLQRGAMIENIKRIKPSVQFTLV